MLSILDLSNAIQIDETDFDLIENKTELINDESKTESHNESNDVSSLSVKNTFYRELTESLNLNENNHSDINTLLKDLCLNLPDNFKREHIKKPIETIIKKLSEKPESKPTSRSVNKIADDSLFYQFWNNQIKKVDKPRAIRSWVKAGLEKDKNKALHVVQEWVKQKQVYLNRDPQYIKHPSTWLNNECWNDELIDLKPKSNQPVQQSRTEKILNSAQQLLNKFENMNNQKAIEGGK